MNAHETQHVQTEEFGDEIPGMATLRAGDVINVHGGLHMVVRANKSNARVQSAKGKERTITGKIKGETRTFTSPSTAFEISNLLPREFIVERQGGSGLAYFLAHRAVRKSEAIKPFTAEIQENIMAKKKSAKAKSANSDKQKPATAAGPKIMDHSPRSVIRALGARGVDSKAVKSILAALKVTVPEGAVPNEIKKGASGKFPLADLSCAQVKELLALVPKESAEQPAAK